MIGTTTTSGAQGHRLRQARNLRCWSQVGGNNDTGESTWHSTHFHWPSTNWQTPFVKGLRSYGREYPAREASSRLTQRCAIGVGPLRSALTDMAPLVTSSIMVLCGPMRLTKSFNFCTDHIQQQTFPCSSHNIAEAMQVGCCMITASLGCQPMSKGSFGSHFCRQCTSERICRLARSSCRPRLSVQLLLTMGLLVVGRRSMLAKVC
mmetsp:Transcript_4418/g.10727  ORF Transcript_4418/g.10727 Transcript_4418/m.10727 type:complete len:206 (-) Transcript_4418:678-1295(-)